MTPYDSFGILVCVKVLLELLPWERIKLLNTSDGRVLEAVVGAVFAKSGINLTRAEDYAIDILWFGNRLAMLWIGDDPLEL